jgi:hypothetical protein
MLFVRNAPKMTASCAMFWKVILLGPSTNFTSWHYVGACLALFFILLNNSVLQSNIEDIVAFEVIGSHQ